MPLSEEELRMLHQMEQALAAEDPKFASTLRGTKMRTKQRRRAYVAAGVFVLGVVALMTGAVARMTVVGIVGFVIMLVAAYVAVTSWIAKPTPDADAPEDEDPGKPADPPHEKQQRRHGGRFSLIQGGKSKPKPSPRARRNRKPRAPRPAQSGTFMERMEERWRRRREQGGF